MSWILLIVAGLLEVAWAAALPATHGLTRPAPTAAFLIALAASMFLLARATQTIPLGTAYVVWVGIGAVGAVAVGLVLYGDPATPARVPRAAHGGDRRPEGDEPLTSEETERRGSRSDALFVGAWRR